MRSKTNQYRAERGKRVLEHHQKQVMEYADVDASDVGVADLLADIRHYCDQNNIDFHEVIDVSYQHYLAEIHGADDWLDYDLEDAA